MSRILKLRTLGTWLSLLLLCSCATAPHPPAIIPPSELPADVTMNSNAGRWSLLFVTLRWENGEEMPFVVDTGSSWTVCDKSLQPRLGKRLNTIKVATWGDEHKAGVYAAPKLYLGNVPLVVSNIVTSDFVKLHYPGRIGGVLGMDCLKHYCVQLDFEAGRIRFLDPEQINAAELGEPFPLTLRWNIPFIHQATLAGGITTNPLIDTGYDVDGRVEKGARVTTNALAGAHSETVRLPKCVWGGETYTNLIVRQADSRYVVGLRFLARHLVTFDFPHQTMYLKQTRIGPLADKDLEATVEFLKELKKRGQVPGWSKHDKGSIFAHPSIPDTLGTQKNRDSSVYYFTVTGGSGDNPWKLQKAWRTDQKERTIEEYHLP